jgi:hypothetical protein
VALSWPANKSPPARHTNTAMYTHTLNLPTHYLTLTLKARLTSALPMVRTALRLPVRDSSWYFWYASSSISLSFIGNFLKRLLRFFKPFSSQMTPELQPQQHATLAQQTTHERSAFNNIPLLSIYLPCNTNVGNFALIVRVNERQANDVETHLEVKIETFQLSRLHNTRDIVNFS